MKRQSPAGIIRFAFKEGRLTKTAWKDSFSKEIAQGADEALDLNVSRAHLLNIKIAQVNEKGKVLEVFANLHQAARFIIETKLAKLKHPNRKKASYGVYGNLIMTSRMGWRAYGFHWVPVPAEAKVTWQWDGGRGKSSMRKSAIIEHRGNTLYFLSVHAAVRYYMDAVGISRKKPHDEFKLITHVKGKLKTKVALFEGEKGYKIRYEGEAA